MLRNEDYKNVLETISTPLLVTKPIFNDKNEIADFMIEFANEAVSDITKSLVRAGMMYSDFKDRLSKELSWQEMAQNVLTKESPQDKTFYSIMGNCWLKVIMSRVAGGYVAITLTNISKDKENEQQLKRQNLRLASLTDELSMSRSSLRTELDNIQTLNQQLLFAAYHDTMTNLNNRACFNKCSAQAEEEASRKENKFGIILFDIDNLRNINESRGHQAGDDVIRRTASILRQLEGEDVTPFRFGGDEFILLKRGISARDEMTPLGDALLSAMGNAGISISGGIAIYPDDSTLTEDLLKYADMAKSEVKKNGKNSLVFFHQVMQEKFLAKINIEQKLSKAIADEVFQLYFQPQFDVNSGALRGFEALLRWHDDELGWISPDQFVPLAEETNLVVPLGDWVTETALSTIAAWERDFNFTGRVSVNVSPVQFKQPDFLEKLTEKISRTGINVAHLELEITEGMLIDNVVETVEKLSRIRGMGIGISLDDFGTGYSSLRYLQILPLTTLKIDKSFISNIDSHGSAEANITESIVSMVSKMGLDTIAEGVETNAQLDVLKRINCHTVQGFLKGKPMPKNLCERMLGGDTSAILTAGGAPTESGSLT